MTGSPFGSSNERKVWGGTSGLHLGVEGWLWVGVWRANGKNWYVVASNISPVVGNQRRVLFWKGKWCGPTPLWVQYPSHFAILTSKDALVSDFRA